MYLVPGGVCSRGVPGPGELSAPEGCLLQGGVCSREGCTWSRGGVCSRGGAPGPRGVSVCSGRVSATGEVYLVPGGCLLQGGVYWSGTPPVNRMNDRHV